MLNISLIIKCFNEKPTIGGLSKPTRHFYTLTVIQMIKNKGLKLLTIASSSGKAGSAISLLNTILGLKERGVEITVAVPNKGFLTDILERNGINYVICPIPYWTWPPLSNLKDVLKFIPKLIRTFYNQGLSIRLLKKKIKSSHINLIHTNVSVINIGYILSKKLSIPHVWHIREYGDLDFNHHSLYGKKGLRKHLAEMPTICITKSLKEYFNLGEKSKVIYNGIEDPVTSPSNNILDAKNDKSLIYVGRLTKKKGVNELVNAFIEFSNTNKDLTLDLIGSYDKDYGEELMSKINSNGLSERIKLIGAVDDPYSYMRKAKAIIVPSVCEGFGRITAEAMINYCLVIGKNTGGTKEQLDNGLEIFSHEIGIRYSSQSDLVTALIEVSKLDEPAYKKIVTDACTTAKELYSVAQNVEATYKYMREVME